jgi:predicted nucleic acid-binding protein
VPVIGTLGVVLRAKVHHEITSARPLLEKLVAAGMFLDNDFTDGILLSIGE